MYADATFYKDSYFGKLIPDAELDSFLTKASDAIDLLTFSRIQCKGGIEGLTDFQKLQVQMAVCTQADFLFGVQDIPQYVQSYSNISNSVSRSATSSIMYSEQAIAYLRPTNLMYRGLGS